MPGYAFGFGKFMALAAPLAVRTFDMGRQDGPGQTACGMLTRSLAVLETQTDTSVEWLSTG